MMLTKIDDGVLELLIIKWKSFNFSDEEQNKMSEMRNNFRLKFTKNKIQKLSNDEYFIGLGKKEGCMAYELEWSTLEIGSIRGGSKYKYGYEDDFVKIKDLLIKIINFDDKIESFYEDGNLTEKANKSCEDSKEIKGLITGRTVIGKLLSIYFPKTFISIFNDQDYILEKLFSDYNAVEIGLELFLKNNFLLLKTKEKLLDKLPNVTNEDFSNDKFMKFLYYCFPKEGKRSPKKIDESFETLEYQHYQTLIHKNFNKLFKDELRYFEPESQNEHNGQYITEDAGTMDFLCLDKDDNFVVIELKRKANDTTVGQICRYMGYVKQTYCNNGKKVSGLILADDKDKSLTYALNILSDVIEFRKIELNIKILKE